MNHYPNLLSVRWTQKLSNYWSFWGCFCLQTLSWMGLGNDGHNYQTAVILCQSLYTGSLGISWTSIAMSVCTAKIYLLPSLQLYVGMVPTCCKLWPFVLTLSNGKEPKRATSWMLIDQVSCIQSITKNNVIILGWYESLVHLETRSKEVCAWKLEWSFERYSLSHNH